MLRKEIQAALEAAAAISIHHESVVVGSLSVLGLLAAPPELMPPFWSCAATGQCISIPACYSPIGKVGSKRRTLLLRSLMLAACRKPCAPSKWVGDCKSVGAGDKALVYLGCYLNENPNRQRRRVFAACVATYLAKGIS